MTVGSGETRPGPGLASPGTHAILIGTGRHVPGSTLREIPSVDTTLDDLQRVLQAVCGIPAERVHRVPADAGPTDVIAAVEHVVAAATGPVLFHYVGHGLLGPGNELYLATRTSRSAEEIAGTVSYHIIKGLLGQAVDGSAVILDCCFSGRAAMPGSGRGVNPFAAVRPRGGFLLSSASYYDLSYAPAGERHTLFTGRLLDLLESGDPSGPPLLTLDHVHAALDRALRDGPARPYRQSEGTLGDLVLARNRAYRDAPGPEDAPPADVPCPYPGMESFRAEDSGYFHGRDALTESLLAAVKTSVPGPLLLIGASGVGKSSLLRAGLIARLESDEEEWPVFLLPAPGPRPMSQLAELWAGYTDRPLEEVRAALGEGRLAPPLPGHRPCRLLVVDQFEEVFTRCQDDEERARFISVLTKQEPGGPRIVVSLRADHYGSCLDHPGLVRALAVNQLAVPPMTTADLRTAVEHPARAAGLTLQAGLTDRLLHDLRQGGRAGLPFLAHALRETWLRRSGAVLTLAGYQATGGIWQAVTTTTEKLYQELDDSGRAALRELLLRMVHVTADGSDAVRRRIPTSTLLPSRHDAALVDRLVAARLVTINQDSAQISHEALLHAWPRLRRWIDEDRAELRLRQQISYDADAWLAAGRDKAFLYRGTRLQSASELLEQDRLPRDPVGDFLAKSGAAEGAERALEARRIRRLKQALGAVALVLCLAVTAAVIAVQQRGTADAQRRLATYRALRAEAENLGATQPQTALRLGVAAYRLQPSAEARSALFDTLAQSHFAGRTRLTGRSLHTTVLSADGGTLAVDDLDDRRRVLLWDVRVPGEQRRLAAFTACQDELSSVSFSPDGHTLAVSCEDGTIGLWKVRGPTPPDRIVTLPVTALPGKAEAVRFSPDGRTLGAVGWWKSDTSFGALVLWDMRNSAQPRQLGIRRGVYDSEQLEFSADGRTLATANGTVMWSEDPPDKDSITHRGGATLWDITDRAHPKSLTRFEGVEETLAFSPDGRRLVTTDGGTIQMWNISTPAEPRRERSWNGHKTYVTAFAFRADGKILATGSMDETVVLWNVTDPVNPSKALTLSQHDRTVESVAFSTDGRQLVSAAGDEVIRWKATVRGPRAVEALGQEGSVSGLDISPDGKLLATGGNRETVDLWDFTHPLRPKRLASLTGHTKGIEAVAFSPDGRALVSGDTAGTLLFWDLTDPARPRRAATARRPHPIFSLAFSPRGTTLVATDGIILTGSATLWNVEDLDRPREQGAFSNAGLAYTPRFSPDGRLLALPTQLKATLWDLNPATKPVELPSGKPSSAFAPDGRTLATGDIDRPVLLWDISDPRHPRKIADVTEPEGGDFSSFAFHPQGNLLAGAGEDGDIVLWAVGERSRSHRAATLTELTDSVEIVRFTPDGRYLLGADGRNVLLWDLDDFPDISADVIGRACAVAGGGLTKEEWDRYVPGLPYRQTCPSP
ncbi:hypothetical protein ACFRCI_15075 [Streptomyces sp. NPDC056638]|uniref:caspase, EACC1-associated type n=1 Tax=Streptomyces sp. NPDC056638 TaxID=3345887 RepID=UPI0036C78D20